MTLRGIIWASVSTAAQAEDDKTSIPSQISEGQRWAEHNSVHIIDTLVVPGHSRRYTRIEECSRDMLKVGIDAFDKLMRHWRARDFDVLIVRDGNRFARTQSLHATVVEDTINMGARLFSMSDGWVDESNYRMFIAMNGYMAASYIDHLVKGTKKSKNERTSRGIPTGPKVVYSHKAIRNEYGKILEFVVDESKRRLFDDVKRVLVNDRVSWKQFETVLFEKYGHGQDGKPFKLYFFYRLLHNPWFWGHAARHYKGGTTPNGQKTDLWVFDSSLPVPEGVLMWRDQVEAVYKNQEAEEVKAELRRRRAVIRGTARPHRTRRFSGLLICEYCGYRMVFSRSTRSFSYSCRSKYTMVHNRTRACTKTRHITPTAVQDWVDAFLRIALDGEDPFSPRDDNKEIEKRISSLKLEIREIENQIRRLISKQSTAPDTLASLYDEQINSLAEQVRILKENLTQAERAIDTEEHEARGQALEELKLLDDLEQFWQLPEVEINQWLHRFFRNWRIRVKDQQIVGLKKV